MHLPKMIRDCFTGPDGATWAIGRVYSLPVLLAGLAVPFAMIARGQAVDLAAFGTELAGMCAAIAALVGLTNHTEPKGD